MFPSLEYKAYDVGNPCSLRGLWRGSKNGLAAEEVSFQLALSETRCLQARRRLWKNSILSSSTTRQRGGQNSRRWIVFSIKTSEKAFTVELAYFYQKGCPKCDRANSLLKYLNKKYPGLKIQEIDLNTPDGKRLNETLSNRPNLPRRNV